MDAFAFILYSIFFIHYSAPNFREVHQSCGTDPKPERACHEQGELCRKMKGGPNRLAVQYYRMTCDKK